MSHPNQELCQMAGWHDGEWGAVLAQGLSSCWPTCPAFVLSKSAQQARSCRGFCSFSPWLLAVGRVGNKPLSDSSSGAGGQVWGWELHMGLRLCLTNSLWQLPHE